MARQVFQIRGVCAARPATAGRAAAHRRANHCRPGSQAGPSQRATSTPGSKPVYRIFIPILLLYSAGYTPAGSP